MAHFVPLPNVKAPELAKRFLKEIWRLHSVPEEIISDRDSRFTSNWWQNFCELINSKMALSTAFHPETDGQTERVNQILEQYLRIFATKSDWDELLPLAEFKYNNSKHSGSGQSPFYTNFGLDPRSIWPIKDQATRNPASELYAHYLENTHKQLRENLLKAQV